MFFDDQITKFSWYRSFSQKLGRFAGKSDLIIRVATGAVLLLSWQSGSLLVPELSIYNSWLEFSQLILAIAILSNRYTVYAGYGLAALYVLACFNFGIIHLLDYAYLPGAAYYLVVSGSKERKKRASALPALYASVGFSLCWVSLEKVVYPFWGLQILEAKPFLTLGFDPNLFLMLAAFAEFVLGFLLIVCLLQRPIALAITILFISTTLVFGKLEFIGHAIVHAALIVFLLQGAGATFRTPITFFKRLNQRIAFAVMSFSIVFICMLAVYTNFASNQYELAMAGELEMPHHAYIEAASPPPQLTIEIEEDLHGGWNLQLLTADFTFAPEMCGKEHISGQGHAHLYVNDTKVARLYGPWFHIGDLPPGKHEIKVTLTSNDHNEYTVEGVPLSSSQTVVVL